MVFYNSDGSLDFYYLNVLVFLANILFGYYHRTPVVVVSSVVCLAIIFYLRERDGEEKEGTGFVMDQIALLGVLVPGLVVWLRTGPQNHPIAGTLFVLGLALYVSGLLYKTYGHSEETQTREYWRFIMHLFSTSGHLALLFEPALLALLSKRA
jgi:hypothetical protein